jgi:hypothetical protein
MFRPVPLPVPLPMRRATRQRWLASRLTVLAETLERRPTERRDTHLDHESHLAELRHRIFSRYY